MVKFLFLTDSHITGKYPRMRNDENLNDTFINKFKDVMSVAKNNDVDFIIHGGDMFHSPDVSNKLVGEIAKILNPNVLDTPPMYVCPGNHDLQGQNIETLPFTKLGLLDCTGVIKVQSRKSPITIHKEGLTVKVEFQEYYHGIDGENKHKDYSVDRDGADVSVLVIHSMLLDKPFLDQVHHTVVTDVDTDADLVLSGHYHEGFDPIKHNGTLFINPGSAFRVDYTNHNKNNKPKMVLITIDNDKSINYDFIYFDSAKDFSEVFDESKREKTEYSYTIENFNKKLQNISITDINIRSVLDQYVNANEEFKECYDIVSNELLKETTTNFVSESFEPINERVFITKVELKNFQKHKHLEVDFVNGVNAILGSSNAGKTSILRAINWALYDTPKGNSFITTGKSSCSVKLYLSNGYIIERSRSRTGGSGTYALYDLKTDNKVDFKGFSNSTPMPIINAHQMPEITIVDKKYKFNISNQLDGPFMVGASSNEKLNMIGALIDTETVDKLAKTLKSDAQKIATKKTMLEDELETVNEEIEAIGDLSILENAINKITKIEDTITNAKSNIDLYNNIINKYRKINGKLDEINRQDFNINPSVKDLLYSFNNSLDTYNDLYNNVYNRHHKVKYRLDSVNTDIGIIENNIKELSEFVVKGTIFMDIEETNNNISELNKASNIIKDIKTVQEHLNCLSNIDNLNDLKTKFIDTMREYISLSDVQEKYIKIFERIKRFDIDVQNCIMSIEQIETEKQNALERLKGNSYICSECGTLIEY